jgi:hypothetical protein
VGEARMLLLSNVTLPFHGGTERDRP